MADYLGKIIGLSVGLLAGAICVPIALDQIAQANTTAWNAAVATVFTVLLPILAVIALALYFMPKTRGD